MRLLKIIAWIVGGLVAVLIIGIALIAIFFDPNDYKPQIEQAVAQQTGRSFTLNGELKLSVFPWLAVQVGTAQLGNAAGFGDTPMVDIKSAKLGVKLRPLLSGQFEIGAIELDSPRIVLIKTATGDNWSDLSKPNSTTNEVPKEANNNFNASVASVTIKNGFLSYEDRAAGSTTELSKLNMSTGKLTPGEPFDLQLSFLLAQDKTTQLQTELAANITADIDNSRYQVNAPTIKLLLKNGSYPQGLPVTINAQSITADTAVSSYQIAAPSIALTLTGEGYPKDGLPIAIKANTITANLNEQTATIAALAIDAADAKITGEVQAKQIMDAPAVTGSLKLAQLSPRTLAKQLNIELPATSDANTLQKFSMETGLAATKTSVTLKPLTLHLDDTTISGSAGIADLDSMALRFDLSGDTINVDRYLAPTPETKQQEAATEPTPIPVDTLRSLNMKGSLKFKQLTVHKLPLTQLLASVNAANGKLQLSPMQASLYEGKYQGNIALDASGKLPQLQLEQQLQGINFAPLFATLFDTKRVSGHGTTSMKLAANGADSDAMKKTLSGNLNFSATDGALEGFDLWYEIRRARALLKQQTIPTRTDAERTAFTTLSGSATVTNGKVHNPDLVAALKYLKVTGQGDMDLNTDKVDYSLSASVLKIPPEDKLAAETQDIVGLTIPVKITGVLTDPKVRPDVSGILKEKAKERINEEKQKLEEKAKDKLKDKLKGFLGG